jgi:hypothetical protein
MRFATEDLEEPELESKFGQHRRRFLSVDSDSDESEAATSDDSDSEEEAFPVEKGPRRHTANIGLYSGLDLWELKDQQARNAVWVRFGISGSCTAHFQR